jgi:Transcriptional regulator C-terminal region
VGFPPRLHIGTQLHGKASLFENSGELAQTGRHTAISFAQHLNEIYDVLEEGGIIGEGRPEGLIDEEIIGLFKQIQQFPDFYRVILGPQADAFLSQRFRQQTQQRVLAYFHQTYPEAASDPDTLPLDLKFTTIATAGCSALGWWLEQERPSPPEQFAHWVRQLIYDISISTLKPKK